MKLSVRPLKGQAFEVETDPDEKVESLKVKIEAAQSEFPAKQQKLIYSGKIMDDTACVKEYNIKQGDFIVVMVAKAKPPAAAAATAAPAAEAPTAGTAPAASPPAAAAGGGGGAAPTSAEGASAARAAPASPPAAAPAAPAAAAPVAAGGNSLAFPAMPQGGGGGEGGGGGGEGMTTGLEELRNHPRFNELAAVVAQNPALLEQILPALATTHPELVQAITENPEEFLYMLQDSVGGDEEGDEEEEEMQIDLSEAEEAAVQRLVGLGFEYERAIEAYLACDKNEEIAANYLFESMED